MKTTKLQKANRDNFDCEPDLEIFGLVRKGGRED